MEIEQKKVEVEIPATLSYENLNYEPTGEFRPPNRKEVYLVEPKRLIMATYTHNEPCFIYSKIEPWRADYKETFYYVDECLKIHRDEDCRYETDDNCYELGNYFKTEEEAKKAANKLRQVYKELNK